MSIFSGFVPKRIAVATGSAIDNQATWLAFSDLVFSRNITLGWLSRGTYDV